MAFQSEAENLRTSSADAVNSSPNVCRLETQEELMFLFKSKGRKKPVSHLKAGRQGEFPRIGGINFLFCSDLQLIG